MIDPVSAFALAQGAIKGVRALTALYKEAKEAGKEVSDMASEVTGHVTKFMEGHQALQEAEVQAKINPVKEKSLKSQAFENIMRRHEMTKMMTELREMMVYELGIPGIWAEFEAELARLDAEQKLKLKNAEKLKRELQRQRQLDREKWTLRISITTGIIIWVFVFCILLYGVHLDYKEYKSHQVIIPDNQWISDPDTIYCWKVWRVTGKLPAHCNKD